MQASQIVNKKLYDFRCGHSLAQNEPPVSVIFYLNFLYVHGRRDNIEHAWCAMNVFVC